MLNNIPKWDDYKTFRKINDKEFEKEIKSLIKWDANENKLKIIGNKIIYHYQFENIAKTKGDNGKTKSFYEWLNDETLRNKLYEMMLKRNRKSQDVLSNMFEALRANKGSIVIFRPSTAKFIYKYYKATNVLDFTAGWGGRLLGAFSLNIGYTGIDTNIELKTGYDKMINDLSKYHKDERLFYNNKYKMIYQNCLDVDLSKIEFDLVLTSPPYENLEIYQNMNVFKNRDDFYINFLIEMLNRCNKYIKNNGWICINMSGKMYEILTTIYKYKVCDETHILPQCKNQKNPNKIDYIYCWKKF